MLHSVVLVVRVTLSPIPTYERTSVTHLRRETQTNIAVLIALWVDRPDYAAAISTSNDLRSGPKEASRGSINMPAEQSTIGKASPPGLPSSPDSSGVRHGGHSVLRHFLVCACMG